MEGICPGKGLVEGHLELESPGEASGTSDLYPLTNHPWVGGESSKVGGGGNGETKKAREGGGKPPEGLQKQNISTELCPSVGSKLGSGPPKKFHGVVGEDRQLHL